MAQIWTVMAFSRSKNQLQREFDEDSLKGRHTQNRKLAEQKAQSFAERLNQRQFLKTQDWQPRVELIETLI